MFLPANLRVSVTATFPLLAADVAEAAAFAAAIAAAAADTAAFGSGTPVTTCIVIWPLIIHKNDIVDRRRHALALLLHASNAALAAELNTMSENDPGADLSIDLWLAGRQVRALSGAGCCICAGPYFCLGCCQITPGTALRCAFKTQLQHPVLQRKQIRYAQVTECLSVYVRSTACEQDQI
jgi:hypothetical protein